MVTLVKKENNQWLVKTNAGNIYPVEKCVYRIGAATGGGYKLTHLDLINVSSTPAPALQASLTAATAGDLLKIQFVPCFVGYVLHFLCTNEYIFCHKNQNFCLSYSYLE